MVIEIAGVAPPEDAIGAVPVTEVTPFGGADQVPSPRQKVDADAPVPLFRLVTGRFPVATIWVPAAFV